jgi:DNA-binding beta-propeller fold protein YncE
MGITIVSACFGARVLVLEEQTGELSTADLETGEIELVAAGLSSPFAMVMEPEATAATALVTEANQLSRVNLTGGTIAAVAPFANRPTGLAIDPAQPDTVWVVEAGSGDVSRVRRSDGLKQLVLRHATLARARGLAFEQPGVLLVAEGDAANGGIIRVDLRQSPPTLETIAAGQADLRSPFGLDLGTGGDLAYVTAQAANHLARLDGLASGAVTLHTHIDHLKGPAGLARLSDGRLAIAQHSTNDLVVLDPAACPAPPCSPPPPAVAGLGTPGDLALDEPDTALVLERNHRDTGVTPGALSRVHTKTGKVTLIASGLTGPEALILVGRTAYVAERGAVSNSPTGRLLMVNLDSGAIQLVSSQSLSMPSGLGLAVVDPVTLVVTERGAGAQKLSLLTALDGKMTPVPLQTPIAAPLGIAMAPDREYAYVTDASVGALYKVKVTNCTATAPCPVETVATSLSNPSGVALEPAGTSALVITNTGGAGGGAIVRVFLQSPTPPFPTSTIVRGLNTPQRIVIEPGGATALVTENDPDAITRVALPAP